MISTTIARNLPQISGYSLTEQLYSGQRTAVYRATRVSTDARSFENSSLANSSALKLEEQPKIPPTIALETASPTDSVIIKVLQLKHPDFNSLVQFRNQYNITKNLSIPGIIRPLSLEPWPNGYALVVEDFGGISLNQYLKRLATPAEETGEGSQKEIKQGEENSTKTKQEQGGKESTRAVQHCPPRPRVS
ncbi:MAG: hypothetical protein AAGC93_13930 [Cyanobacteria bacterium P01_F01_bin.53]